MGTIMPVFSQDKVAITIDADKIPDLDKHVQNAGTEVVEAKGGKGSATLSMAYAGARFGKGGIVKVLPLGELNEYETKRLDEAKAQLKTEIETGLKYAEANSL